MKSALAREVVAMLSIEAGEPLYYFHEEVKLVLRRGIDSTRVYVDGFDRQLIVEAKGHLRGFRFRWREGEKYETRFDWKAIHKRVEACLAEAKFFQELAREADARIPEDAAAELKRRGL